MKITLTRYMQNRNYVHGRMRIEGSDDVFETLEMAIPQDKFSYVKHCLPPCVYKMVVEQSLIQLDEGSVRRPWLSFGKVKWFPKAGVYTHFEDRSLLSGRIFVGMESKDEWSVEQSDVATAKIIAALEPIYDHRTDETTEPVTLEIIEPDDIEYHDYDLEEYNRQLMAEQEAIDKANAEMRLQELMGC